MITFSVEDRLAEMGVALDELGEAYEAIFNQGVASVAKAAHNEWVRLAQERLHTSREIYVNGLRAAESFKITETNGAIRADIQLVGREANNFEFGMGSFDMKSVRPGWLGGGKAKTAKDGSKYIVIPFRHSKSSDSRFGYTGKAAAVSGPDLKTQLRAATKQYGLDRALTGSAGEVATRRIPRNASVHPYLKGLQKTEYAQPTRSGGMKRTSTLNTFRVMSEKSAKDSWIHPGLKAKNLLAEVETFTDKEFDRMIDVILMGAG